MRGLDGEELEAMDLIRSAWMHGDIRRSVLNRLQKRGLITGITVQCGALYCPGHHSFEMTSVGLMVWNAVRQQ